MFKELLPSKTSQFSSFHRWKKKMNKHVHSNQVLPFWIVFLVLVCQRILFKCPIIHYCQLYLVHINMEGILSSSLICLFFIQSHIYNMQTIQYNVFVFISVVFTIFILKSGYMLEQEQSEEKYTYIYTTWLIVLYFYYCNT